MNTITLESGTLWKSLLERTDSALKCSALEPIPTEYEFVEQDGINFLVRIISNLARKDEAKKQQDAKKEFNPFLPYDEELFVCDLSQSHLCLLNKYNVVDYHLLIITRLFEDQETWLTLQDFEAMWTTLAEIDGLAFYNSGKEAGASQQHKHLQLIPLPMTSTGEKMPIAPLITSANLPPMFMGKIPSFPFAHAFASLNSKWINSPTDAALAILELYYELLKMTAVLPSHEIGKTKPTKPYNLLVTREWMMIIPRSQESFASISVNSLGFAGALLVRHPEQMQLLKEVGPMTVLKSVSLS